jgi:uncharacterized membrane protein YuzA (DUF378 family)
MEHKMGTLGWIAFVLLIIGGLNWGLAVFDFNLVSVIFGTGVLSKIIYALVGLSAIFAIIKISMWK